MSIFLSLLKIIGIIILCILAFIIVVLLAVLFVPIAYNVKGNYRENLYGKCTLSWLFHILHVTILFEEGKVYGKLRILGILFYNTNKIKQQKHKVKKKKKISKASKDSNHNSPNNSNSGQCVKSEKAVEQSDAKNANEKPNKNNKVKRKSKGSKESFKAKFKRNLQSAELWKEKLLAERTIEAFKTAKYIIIKLFKHVMPTKYQMYLEFGTGEPDSTAKFYGYYCMFIPLWGNHFICVPDFDNKKLVADLNAKGYIFSIVLIHIAIQLGFHKDMKYLRKLFTS